ncbi:hypothetical protein [Nonomuraea sp. PA05]|uniref:hypothetical protein n=1 Tax=Nonomuraea sp. PA05 TaxID=2604466 RepID=UPI0021CCC298
MLTGNADDATDLVQEAPARLGGAWPRVRNPRGTSARPWCGCTSGRGAAGTGRTWSPPSRNAASTTATATPTCGPSSRN